ncbi:MAG: hypothetical protein LBQ66_07785 [Planctomycetaceae bacterium]|jgi:anti-sigma28 factor (negative regulator of flagellin synthesis)|nr:hypothetical protein [Planctomycetaceae bacterium]
MEIYPNLYTQHSQKLQSTREPSDVSHQTATNNTAETSAKKNQFRDDVKFTGEAIELSNKSGSEPVIGGIRFDLVNRVRAEIAAGTYETPEKMDVAIDKMIGQLNLV